MAANSGCLNLSWTGTSEPAVRDRCHPKVPELSALSKLIEPTAIPDVYVIVRRRDQVLLLLRSGPGYKDGEWGPPSGKVEPGESYGDAAARELHEETGISVSPTDLRLLCVLDRIPDLDNRWIGEQARREGAQQHALAPGPPGPLDDRVDLPDVPHG